MRLRPSAIMFDVNEARHHLESIRRSVDALEELINKTYALATKKPLADADQGSVRPRVLQYMQTVGIAVRPRDVVANLPGTNLNSVGTTLLRLLEAGEVERVSKGLYQLPQPKDKAKKKR